MTAIHNIAGRPDWVVDAVFYQIFPDRFRNADRSLDPVGVQRWGAPPDREHFQGGDLVGVVEGLAHLQRLGVTGLYLNPVFAAGTNHRYDTWDYFSVDPYLGDLGVLRELVDEAHHRGIRVVLDGVFNHCGAGHPAFRDWRANGRRSPYARWFTTWSPQPGSGLDYQTCGGADYLPKLNVGNHEVRDHILRAATYWIEEAGIDGWRLDVPYKVPHDFWETFRATVKSVHPDAYLLGEVWRDASLWLDVFDGVTNYRQRSNILDFCLHDAFDGEDFAQETNELLETHGSASAWMLNLVGSHDTARVLTLAGGSVDRVRCAFAAMFTLPGVPLIYYGDEIGLAGGDDPDCRRAMPWDEGAWNHEILSTVATLIAVRANSSALRRGAFRPLAARNGLVAFERVADDDRALVIINPRGAQSDLRLPIDQSGGADPVPWCDMSTGGEHLVFDGCLVVERVEACSFSVIRPRLDR